MLNRVQWFRAYTQSTPMLLMRPSCLRALMVPRSWWVGLQGLISWLFEEPNPIGVNTALAMCGVVQPVFRLPYVPLSRQQRATGRSLLQPLLDDIPGETSSRPSCLRVVLQTVQWTPRGLSCDLNLPKQPGMMGSKLRAVF